MFHNFYIVTQRDGLEKINDLFTYLLTLFKQIIWLLVPIKIFNIIQIADGKKVDMMILTKENNINQAQSARLILSSRVNISLYLPP